MMHTIPISIAVAIVIAAPSAAEYDLRTVSAHTAESIAGYMHPETRHMAEDVIRICADEGISAEFIVSVMRWERRPDLHNWFGWTGSDGRLMRFKSDADCLERVIPLIKRNYLTEGGKYFNGFTVKDVNRHYNGTDFWEETIEKEMERMFINTVQSADRRLIGRANND